MIKRIIKLICYKIYEVGYFVNLNKVNEERLSNLSRICILGDDVWLSSESEIYNKSLPRQNISIGSRTRIMGQIFLFDTSGSVLIGEDCFVGPQSKIWSSDKIVIGNRVLIAHNVNIHDNISHPLSATDRYEENKNFIKTGIHENVDIKAQGIKIEDDVWIGFNSTIMKGVKIGRGAIIGSNSVVTKDVAAWTVNVGNPLRVVRELEPVEF